MYSIAVTKLQAENNGFIIEDETGYLYDLGCTNAILGYSSLDETWRFDVSPDPEGDVYSFVEKDFAKAISLANSLAAMMQAYTKYMQLKGFSLGDLHERSIQVLKNVK